MDKDDKKGNNGGEKQVNGYAKYTGMGFQMIAVIGLFTWAGYEIDKNAHHDKLWVTAILSLTGVFISLYLVIRSAKS